jgi:hypothetical protein
MSPRPHPQGQPIELRTYVWAGIDYGIAELVAKHMGRSLRSASGYMRMPHDGDCSFNAGDNCDPCLREYRLARVGLWRKAKLCCDDPDTHFVELLDQLQASPTYWD